MQAGTTSIRYTKPVSDGTSETAFALYRTYLYATSDYEINTPYTLTFAMRASVDKFSVSMGARQSSGSALFFGDNGTLVGTDWREYTVVLQSAATDTNFRFPYFKVGQNTQAGWIEVTDLKIARGNIPSANIEPYKAPKVRALTDAATITWNIEWGDLHKVTLTGNRTLAVPVGSPYDGQLAYVRVLQDATGSRTLVLAAGFGDSSVAISIWTAPSSATMLTFQYDSTTAKWYLVNQVRFG